MAMRFIDACGVTEGGAFPRKWNLSFGAFYQASGGRRGAPYYELPSAELFRTLTQGTRWIVGAAWAWRNANAGPQLAVWNDGALIAGIWVNADYTVSFNLGGGGGTVTTPSVTAIAAPTDWHYYELDVTLSSNTSGNVQVQGTIWVDGNLVLSTNHATSIVASALISGSASANQVGAATIGTGSMMDFYALDDAATDINGNATTNTARWGDVEIDALMPVTDVTTNFSTHGGDGTHAYSCVNETPADDDTSYVFSSATTNIEKFNHQPITGFVGTILGAQYSVCARKDSEGLRTFVELVGTSTVKTIEFQGTENFLSEFYYYYVAPLDSDNGVAWTTANYNAEAFGVKLIQ